MLKINENYAKLKESYLFSEIAHRVSAYSAAHPDKKLIKMGIGDVDVIQVEVSRLNSKNGFESQPAPWIITGKAGE